MNQKTTIPLSVIASDRRELRSLRVMVNGSALPLPDSVTRLSGTRAERTFSVPLLPGSNRIQVSAINAMNLESLRVVRSVSLSGPARAPALYVVGIGVSQYGNESIDLKTAAQDARALTDLLKRLGPSQPGK